MILTMLHFVIYVRKIYQFNTFKVRDHDHLTGKFRGASHQNEDINYFNNRYLPVSFTNKNHMMVILSLEQLSKSINRGNNR